MGDGRSLPTSGWAVIDRCAENHVAVFYGKKAAVDRCAGDNRLFSRVWPKRERFVIVRILVSEVKSAAILRAQGASAMVDEKGPPLNEAALETAIAAFHHGKKWNGVDLGVAEAIEAYLSTASPAPAEEGWTKIAERMTKWRADVEEAKNAEIGYVGKSQWIERLFKDVQYDVFRLVNDMTAAHTPTPAPGITRRGR